MKNLNLIKRLLANSHERQKVRSVRRYTAVLLLLLTCVTHAWGIGFNQGNIFFDATGWGTTTYMQFAVGHDSWSSSYPINTHVENTNLYRGWASNGGWWSGCNYFAVFSSDHNWDTGSWSYSNISENAACYSGKYTSAYDINSGNIYVLTPSSSSDGASFEIDYKDGITDLNYRQDLTVQVKDFGDANYSNAANCYSTSISASTYYFDAAWDEADQEGSISLSSTTVTDYASAAFTSTVSLSLSGTPTTGYQFDGWYYSDGTRISTSTSASYNARGATTIYARFSQKSYTISYGVNSSTRYGSIILNSGSSVSTTSSSTLAHGTSLSFTASPNTGYQVEGWYSDAACTVGNRLQSGGTSYDAGTLTAAKTVYVKFEAKTGGIVTLNAGTGGQVSLDNSSWGSTKTKSSITTNTAFNIYAKANTGYSFSSWASTGSGTVYSTTTANTTFTPVAFEDATVTASFSENMSTLTTANSYDGASAGFSNPTKSVSSIGITTTATVTAASNSLGYTLTSWTIENGERTDGGDENANPITVRSDGSGNAVTVTANYTGSNRPVNIYLSGTMNSWTTSSSSWQFYKLPGESGNTVTLEVDVNKYNYSGDSYKWGFNIYHSDWDKKWWNNRNDYDTNMDAHNCEDWGFNVEPNSKRTYLDLNVSGKYIFTLENSTNSASQSLTVTYPDKSFVEGAFPTPWDEDAYELDEDGDVQTVTINITSTGDKQFRLVSHGKLFGTSTKITKDANEQTLSAKNMNDGGATMTLSASVIGEYTFTYDEGDKELTVTYPSVSQLQIYSSTSAPDPAVANVNWDSHEGNVYSKTVSLKANTSYTFKAVVASDFYTNGGTATRSTSTASNTLTSLTTSGSNMMITTDFAGDYTFAFDISAKTLVVTYPTAYQATFTKSIVGTDNSTTSAPTASYNSGATSVTSATTWIPTGTDVTFLAATEGTGYTWKGWYSKANPSPDYEEDVSFLDGDKEYTAEITSAVTIYAVYEEILHTVTVTPGTHGSITTPDSGTPRTVKAGIATAASIEATPATDFYFGEWEKVSGSVTFTDEKSASTTVKATEDSEIKANFVSSWTVGGSFNGWDMDQYGLDNFGTRATGSKDTAYVEINFPANTTYSFKIYDRENTQWWGNENYCYDTDCSANAWINYANNNGKEWQFATGRRDCGLITAGKGTYRFAWNITDHKMAVQFPTSWTVTYGKKVIYNETDGTLKDADTEGRIVSVVDGDEIALESGKYVVGGGSVTVVAEPATGYEIAGWYSDAACTSAYTSGEGGVTISGEGNTNFTITSLAANTGIYVKFAEKMTTVNFAHNAHGHVTIDGGTTATSKKVGVHTTYNDLTAVPDWGYYFAGWEKTAGSDYSITADEDDEDQNVNTLAGLGGGEASDQTLTARFVELEKVYFRNWNAESNVPLWSDVYVYFNVTFVDDCAKSNSSSDFKAQMALESGNVYWAYVPRSTTRAIGTGGEKIAFSNTSFETNTKFNSGEAVKRGDYSSGLSMFVPRHASTETVNGTKYYKGYWKHHNLEPGTYSGYQIKRYNGSTYVEPQDNGTNRLKFIVEDENTIVYSLRVDNPSVDFQKYKVISAGNIDYITYNSTPVSPTGYDITITNYSAIPMSEYIDDGNPYFRITPTSQNIYTLKIDMSSDEMTLTVDYPVALGDYRIVHTYNSGAKKSYSDIIKSAEAGSGVTASMYINTSGSPTLSLEKCTNVNPVTWTAQTSSDVWSTYSGSLDKNGVYQFDVTITAGNSNTNSSISNIQNIKIYDGEFYIKTDIAPGGWTAWEANVMEKNTITFNSADSKTFDRSFCHWVEKARSNYPGSATNVKCVIANAYNIAVSDTVEDDAIIGDGANKYQTLPYPANVRFSYNSTTNELKRTYLSLAGENKLQLEGNTVSSASMIRNTDGTTFTNNATTLTALSNFTYKVDVQAREKARVRLTSIYQSNNQSLVGTFTSTGSDLDGADNAKTVEVLGGNTSNPGYKTMRIIYDFKTNYVMAAWLVDADVNVDKDTALQADLMIIRQEQGDAYQLTFGDNKSMTEVKNVYGVIKFTQSFITNSSESRYKRDLYWISFPFDVKLSDAFGMGTYGIHWIVERYDGYTRARKGFWADSPSNWKFITPYQRDSGFVMKANEGYILALDLDELGDGSLVWDNGKTDAYLYFPSDGNVGTITQEATKVIDINQDGYQCTINRATGTEGDRRIKDSYWHCIGAPSYANVSHSVATEDPSVSDGELWSPTGLLYFYKWKDDDNTLSVQKSSPQAFKAMHSYLVQYCNDKITWENVNKAPSPIAARLAETPDKEFQLALTYDDEEQDHTYVRLTDETGVTNRFEFNQDLSKEYNGGKANIWTVTADTVPVAGNCMPKPVQTTVVPVGVKIATNGEYTFSMPEGTNGGDVWLIDNANSSRTNLGLMDYTVNLTTGTYEGRFSLEFPVQNVVTEIENAANANANANANADAVRKVFVGGQLYIIRDGVIYNASGARVQ